MFAFAACAIPLAPACGARTNEAQSPTERRIHARLEFPTIGEAKPLGLLAADLDGDGKSEIIGVTSGPAALQVWSQIVAAPRQWPEPRAFPIDDFALGPVWLGGQAPASKTAAAEIVIASRAKPGVTVFDVRAAWTSKPDVELQPKWHVDLERRPRVLASGDLLHDGKFEIAIITVDDDLRLVRASGDIVTTRLGDAQATCARFGDDGQSLYVGFQGSRRLVRYSIDAQGKPVETCAASLDGLPRAIDEAKDAAGQPLIFLAGGDDALWTFAYKDKALKLQGKVDGGTIPFALVHGPLAPPGEQSVSIALHGQVAVVRAVGAAKPEPMARVYAGQHPRAGALGDFDGDGHLDLAVANGDAKRVSVMFGDGQGGFDVAPAAPTGRGPHALAVGDLDGDGKPDVVALNALEGTLSVLRNRGGTLAAHEMQGVAPSSDAVRLADLDGDGHLDAAFLRRTDAGSLLTAYFGDGQGHLFQRAEVMPVAVGASSGDLLITDLDGDGALEALVADPEGSRVALVPIERVPGPGCAFGAARAIEVPSGPRALALVDAEGDARAEVAVALGGPGPRLGVAILRAKKDSAGALVLEEARYLPRDRAVNALAAADFDGDGRSDLAMLVSNTESDTRIVVAWQATDRTWNADDAGVPTGLRPYALRAADVDGDGGMDLLCSAQNSHHVNLWLNGGGKPVYFARSADLGAGTGPLDLQVADLFGDGSLTILVANAFSNDVSVIRVR